MPFQTQVGLVQAPAVAGDFATTNPRHSVPSVPGGFMAGPQGVTIGLAAWADTATGTILSNYGTGAPTCIIHRAMQATIATYLSEYGMTTLPNVGVGEMFNGCDMYVKNAGAGAVTIGMKAFANNTNGTWSFAATGTTVTGSTETKYIAMRGGAAGELVVISNTPLG